MKVFFSLLVIMVSYLMNGQEIDSASENEFFKIFVGAGASFSDGYEINNYLSKNNIQTLNPIEINAITGLIFYNKFLDIDLGYEMFASGNSNEKTKNRLISNGIKLRANYVFPVFKDIEIGTGFNISYSKRKATIYYTDYVLDFNNLTDGINGNQISLFNEKSFLGPSFCIKIKGVGRNNQQTKITFSYEFPINNKKWVSDFLEFENNIKEKKRNQFVINVAFCL
jgi:hypothetical protein